MITLRLDEETLELVWDIVKTLQEWDDHRILAILVYGSVARHEARPLDDSEPSDVDILVIYNTDDPAAPYAWQVSAVIEEAYRRHLHAPREVNIQYATRTLAEWDVLFVANVARDGIVLYGEPPEALRTLTTPPRSPQRADQSRPASLPSADQ